MKKILNYFTLTEKIIWIMSVIIITLSFLIFDRTSFFSYFASLLGATSLILNAKGNYIGQIIGIIFCTCYAIISFSYRYYGEVITYLCMTMPFAIVSLISWIKNPYKDNKLEVEVNTVKKKELFILLPLIVVITFIFYFILKSFKTNNLFISTFSIATSTVAVYYTFRRSPYFALAYAINDVVLVILWTLASFENTMYVSMVGCFLSFLINDIYGFVAWKHMLKRQKGDSEKPLSERSK